MAGCAEVEIYMNAYLKEESVGKEKGLMFQNSYAELRSWSRR